MQKINYYNEMQKIINNLDNYNKKLLLHSCCGPCSSAVIEQLSKYCDLTVLYYNPNIDTKEEYEYRAREQRSLIKHLGLDIDVIVEKYDSTQFYEYVKGYEHYKEGSVRCIKCFKLRLMHTANLAKKNNFDYFTTTLSISPHKNSQILNRMGQYIQNLTGVKYLFSDFKKQGGFQRSIELSKEFEMYRQDYCGCEFSRKEMLERYEKN